VRDELEQFTRAGVTPFGVNPAPAGAHAAYAERLRLPFRLLSDPGLVVATAYGAVQPGGRGVARSVVLVDRSRRVRYAQHGAPGASLILEALEGE
jgi:peroxiredoxin